MNVASAAHDQPRRRLGRDGRDPLRLVQQRDVGAATHAAQDVAHGELPGPGQPVRPPDAGERACRTVRVPARPTRAAAMAQLVHDLAPGAQPRVRRRSATARPRSPRRSPRCAPRRTHRCSSTTRSTPTSRSSRTGRSPTRRSAATAAGVPYFSAAGNANVIVGGNNVGVVRGARVPRRRPARRSRTSTIRCSTATTSTPARASTRRQHHGRAGRRLRPRPAVGAARGAVTTDYDAVRRQRQRDDPRRVDDRQRRGRAAGRVPRLGQHEHLAADRAHRDRDASRARRRHGSSSSSSTAAGISAVQ